MFCEALHGSGIKTCQYSDFSRYCQACDHTGHLTGTKKGVVDPFVPQAPGLQASSYISVVNLTTCVPQTAHEPLKALRSPALPSASTVLLATRISTGCSMDRSLLHCWQYPDMTCSLFMG